MIQSFFYFIIGFYLFTKCQYNYNLHFEIHFPNLANYACPTNHVYVVGLYPHTCVSYHQSCLGVTSVDVVKLDNEDLLCHPNFQVNLTSSAKLHKNFIVDPQSTILLTITASNLFQYSTDIYSPNCFIMFAWWNNANTKQKQCLYYNSAYSLGRKPFSDFSLSGTYKDLYSYGSYDEFSAQECPNKYCDGCTLSSTDTTKYNCTSCFGDRYIYGNTKDCSLICSIPGAWCNETNPTPTTCRPGYRKVVSGSTFTCEMCSNRNCLSCDLSSTSCTQCKVKLWNFDYFSITSFTNSYQACYDLDNCIEYGSVASNPYTYNQQCIRAGIGYVIQNPTNVTSCRTQINMTNCYHCASITACLVCNVGYYVNNSVCVQQTPCDIACKTCLQYNPTYCTSCNLEKEAVGGICVCEYVCLTCITYHECSSCKPEQNRILNDTKCICNNGYYDGGDVQFVCYKCHPTCLTCDGTGISNCLTCNEQQNRHLIKGQCNCNFGFGEIDLTYTQLVCSRCHPRCESCVLANNSLSCTTCYSLQMRQLALTSDCQCIDNYGDNAGIKDVCYQCHFTCGSCIGGSQTDCSSCIKTTHRSLINQACICQKGYFESIFQQAVCSSCHYSCLDCQANSAIDYCISCPSTRVANRNGTTFSCLCKDSNYFDDGASFQCQQCHYSCLTCSYFGSSFCLTCDLTIRNLSNQQCSCLDGKYDDGISTCLPCLPTCVTCQGNKITDCLTCATDVQFRELAGGACKCLVGYFEDNGKLICSKCSYRCKTCAITKDQCLTCADNSYRDLGTDKSCQCPLGYYDNGNPICQFCNVKCNKCLGTEENQCIDCKPLSNRYLSNSRCLCLSHYYELGLEQCSMCSQYCLECENTYDYCTSCDSDKIFTGNKCICPSKLLGQSFSTYQVGGSILCLKCHYSCLTCNGSTNNKCIDCYPIENRYFSGSKCLCKDGYFDAGIRQCQQCGYQCLTCVYSPNQCLSCQLNTLRTLSAQSQVCFCQKGYYDDGSNPVCQQCHYSCNQCSIKYDHCIACSLDSYRSFNDILFTCACQQGYYDSGEVNCKHCHYSCYQCNGSSNSQCVTCNTQNTLSKRVFSGGKCICQGGYYDDGFSSACQPCDVSCKLCDNQSYSCTACSTTRVYSSFSCLCLTGYYDVGQKECSKCNSNCLQCKNKATNCISCDATKFRILDQLTKTCICQSNYLEINSVCYQCNTSCLTCLNTISNCSSCDPAHSLSNGQCSCSSGYFEDQGSCQTCHPTCLTCSGNEKFCLSCSLLDLRKLSVSNTCNCIDGYFDFLFTNTCLKCDPSCNTCSLNSLNCTSCDQTLNLNLLINQCVCKQGYYFDSKSKTCLICHISCLSCTQYQVCISCLVNTRIYNGDLNTCDCQQGYFETNQVDCQKCSYQCQTCQTTQSNCLSCHPLANRQLQGNTCQCLQGFFDAGIEVCIACSETCMACQNKSTNCTLCYELLQRRVLVGNTCFCQPGYFDNGSYICQKCSLKCKTCVGSAEYCTSCDTNQKRLDHSQIHKCPCIQDYYDDSQSVCQKCHIKCDGCLNSRDNCLNCRSPQNSHRYFLSDQCNCKSGYYDDKIQLECQKCSSRCQTCVDNSLNCLVCYDNLRINPPTCNCQDGYFEDQTQYCIKCSNQCLTCETSESNCLTCQIGRINKSCDCQSGYYDAGLEICLKCGFQCLECTQSFTNCTKCRGDRIQLPYCNCIDGYYDNGVDTNCQPCDYTCSRCNVEECLACNGNRILSNYNTCDCPENSVSYSTTPWCSNCEAAVLVIRFSDDLTSILIKFDFQVKQTQQIKMCSLIFQNETLNKLGFGYSCDIDEIDSTILKISLGQEPSIIVGDQILFESNVVSHIDCQNKLMTFIFTNVKEPLNYLQPIIQFNIPNFQINSCIENNIYSNFTKNDGKRRFVLIKWSYQIVGQSNDSNLDSFVESLNTLQLMDLSIPAQTLPQNSSITFTIEVVNFLGIQSITSFDIHTQSDLQPIIQVDLKSSYYAYQDINIAFSISIINCRGKAITQSSLFQIDLIETDKSMPTSASSNMNYSIKSSDTRYSVKIPKYTLSTGTIYYFNLSANDINLQVSSYIIFSISIKYAEIMCRFENAVVIQYCKKDLNLHIQCKDLNVNLDWNEDPQLQIDINCVDLFTSQECLNKKNEKIEILSNDYSQTVPKDSMKPFSAQSWQVTATKGNLTKTLTQVIVYLEDNFLPLSMKYDIAYEMRPINNYELLNFTYDIPLEERSDVVEMTLEIISDFTVLSLTQPNYFEHQFTFQEELGSQKISNSNYSFRFSAQFSTNIYPSYFNLPINLNIPPICSKINKNQTTSSSLTKLEIAPVCSKADDEPFQYKFGYFLSETELQEYLAGDKNLILGETDYQMSPKLTKIVPNSFLNQSIYFLVSVLDQGGSITNIEGKTILTNSFNCTLINNQNLTNLTTDMILSQLIQAFGQDGSDCILLKRNKLQQLYSKIDFSSKELSILLKALRISKQYQTLSQQRRILNEESYSLCYNQTQESFSINQTLTTNNETSSITKQIEIELKNFELALSYLTNQLALFKQLLQNQTSSEWDQKLNEQYQQIKVCLLQLYLLADNIFLQISKLSSIDEQVYNYCVSLLNLLSELSLLVQDSAEINGDAVSMVGEIITWELLRQTREPLLKLSQDLEDQIIKFSQKEQIKLQFNPFRFSNLTMEIIRNQFNFTKIIVDPEIMYQTYMKNILISGKESAQNKLETTFNINIKQYSICNNLSAQYQQNNQKAICILVSQNGSINQCGTDAIYLQDDQQVLINCKCQEFGQIFLAFYSELNTTDNSNVSTQEVSNSDSPIFSFNIESTIFYYFIGYVGVVSVVVLLLVIYELKQNNSEEQDIGIQQQDIIKLQIKSYPGNFKIIKENFKFLHQLSQFCYNSGSLIKRSFYFLDITVQFSFMLLIIYLIDLDLDSGKYNKVIEIIFAVTSGVTYRVLSKVLQGFARINNSLKIIIYIFLEIILVTECLIITSNINISNNQKNENKFFNWLIGLAFYEILIELILISFSVYTYKLTFKSINFKEFKIVYHLIYYFAYQERLEKIFQQFIIL